MTTMDIYKKFIPLGIGVIVFIIVGIFYFYPPFGKMICESKSAPGDMSATFVYEVDFSFWRVKKLKVIETVEALDEAEIIRYRQTVEEEQAKFKDLKYYETDIVVDKNTLINTITIDYKNVDRNKLHELEKGFSNNLTRIGKLRKIYINNGATCRNA